MGFPKPAWVTWMRVRGRIPELGVQGGTDFEAGEDFEGVEGGLGGA